MKKKKKTYKKLFIFVWPSIVMMIFVSIYSIVDGYFVSNYAGETQFAAVNFIFPFVMMLTAVGFMIGTGGSALVGKTLGEQNKKKADELYQITLGGNADHDASIGDILGPSFAAERVPDVVEEILNTYLDLRQEGEEFIDTYRRVGIQPFKERAYA